MVSIYRFLQLLTACSIVFLPAMAQGASRTRTAAISVTVEVVFSCQVSAAPARVVHASDVRVACGGGADYAVSLEHGAVSNNTAGDEGFVRTNDGVTATITY